MTDRSDLRNEARARRKAFGHGVTFPVSDELARVIDRAATVGLYLPVGSETPVDAILDHCVALAKPIALPWIKGRSTAMQFRYWSPGEVLETGKFGFRQPADSAASAEPDVVLTPLLAFDDALTRLGQGAGHYDRYFSLNSNVLRIGIAWSVQHFSFIPAEHWDMPLDGIATEIGWLAGPRLAMEIG